MTARIYRYQVPVGGVHVLALAGPVLHVACRDENVVEFWAPHSDELPLQERRFTVVGTGHPVPDGPWQYHGTAIAPGGRLVWHLLEAGYGAPGLEAGP